MTSVDAMPPPLPQVESQPEDLIGSADVDGASALLDGHMPGKVPGLSAASENPASNGTENPPPVNQQAEKSEKTETPASNGTENHPLVNQQAEVLETNGSGSHPGPTDEAKTPALNGGAEQPNFPTGTEKPSVIPPIQPGGKKNNKGVPWYHKTPNDIDPITRNLLETYSQIEPDQVEQHVIAIREKAWDVFPYPCIGQFLFLNLTINLSPYYPTLVSRLRDQGQTILDLGCCFAQDVRKLVSDGAPSQNIYGADLYGEFMDLGFELFRDRKSLKSTFFPCDILNEQDLLLRGMNGEMDIVYLGLFLHHFDFETCVTVCVRITKMLKPKPGSLVMGVQVGSLVGDTVGIPIPSGGILFRHDIESLERVWKAVGEKTGTEWKVEARLERGKGFGEKWQIEGTRRLGFEIHRL